MKRYIDNPTTTLQNPPSAHTQLIKSLTKLVTGYPPETSHSQGAYLPQNGFFTGPTSIAYLFLTLSKTHPNLSIEGKAVWEWCHAYLPDNYRVELDTKCCGVRNEKLAYLVLMAAAKGATIWAEQFFAALKEAEKGTDPVTNEYLRGRAGALALLRILNKWCEPAAEHCDRVLKEICEFILAQKRPWTFHGHDYLGAVHGEIGIVTQIVLSDPTYAPRVEKDLKRLLDLQTESGQWPVTDEVDQELVHFCHGAPGFVISLVSIRPYFPNLQPRIDAAIEKGRTFIWEKGLLTKEPNLCHGVTGNMLAFEQGGEQREHFMAYATVEGIERGIEDGVFKKGDDPWGLWWGEAGRAWGWMVMDLGVMGRDLGWPGYTDV
ncbi:MAG: hypothetical protein MMC33_008351 [Icmadophila ericetorum]|nr:hypothetical protein [Icmadophila ericetorum]